MSKRPTGRGFRAALSRVAGGARAAAASADAEPELFDESFLRKLEYLHVVSKKIFAGRLRAERQTRRVGSGIEFADHRDYALGDDFRYIDWNLYGRMDKLLLRLFEEEEDLHIYLLVDASASMAMGRPSKLRYAMQLAAALCYVGLANLDRVSVLAFRDAIVARLPPARGKGRIFKVFEFLRAVEGRGVTSLAESLEQFVHQTTRRGIAVVLSDFYDPQGYEVGLNNLRYHRFEPLVVQIHDQREQRPPLRGDLMLVDCETGELREVTVSPRVLAAYGRAYQRFSLELDDFCRRRGISVFRTSTAVPFDELVLRVFREGGFLR